MTEQKIITRPRLAAYLRQHGIQIEQTVNPFTEDHRYKSAWIVPDNEETRQLIDSFMKGVGRK